MGCTRWSLSVDRTGPSSGRLTTTPPCLKGPGRGGGRGCGEHSQWYDARRVRLAARTIPMKSPFLAFTLNFFLPGAGLWYLGRPGWGLVNLLVVLGVGVVAVLALP